MSNLPKDTRIVVIRRGETMRIQYPLTQYALDTTTAPELALVAASMFMQLQAQYPGRADLPITSKTGQVALALPMSDDVLNEDEPLWSILAGQWAEYDVVVVGDATDEFRRLPAVALNLVDLNVFHRRSNPDG